MSAARAPAGVIAVLAGALLVAGAAPASAQGNPVGGAGNHYFLAGAGNPTGRATQDYVYGDAGDAVYVGNVVDQAGNPGGDGWDDAIVRRGNTFTIRGQHGRTFSYGDAGDTVLVGDWDGDGTDSLAVRRGNRFFVRNSLTTGVADYTFSYGDAGDTVLVGNWDGDTSPTGTDDGLFTDTLAVRRGNRFYVRNDTTTGVADYVAVFGDPDDVVLVGDWATAPVYGDDPATAARETDHVLVAGRSGDYADQFAVRRGNVYSLSDELASASTSVPRLIGVRTVLAYGDASDTAFTAQRDWTYAFNGSVDTLFGDGLAVRRND